MADQNQVAHREFLAEFRKQSARLAQFQKRFDERLAQRQATFEQLEKFSANRRAQEFEYDVVKRANIVDQIVDIVTAHLVDDKIGPGNVAWARQVLEHGIATQLELCEIKTEKTKRHLEVNLIAQLHQLVCPEWKRAVFRDLPKTMTEFWQKVDWLDRHHDDFETKVNDGAKRKLALSRDIVEIVIQPTNPSELISKLQWHRTALSTTQDVSSYIKEITAAQHFGSALEYVNECAAEVLHHFEGLKSLDEIVAKAEDCLSSDYKCGEFKPSNLPATLSAVMENQT